MSAMTGPEHYRRAEELLATGGAADLGSDEERYLLAAAAVHARLAEAAAIIATANTRPSADWTRVTTALPLEGDDTDG